MAALRAKSRSTTKRRSPSHPVTKQELRENNPSIAEAVTHRLSPYYKLALIVGAIAIALTFVYQGYVGLGGRLLVTDHTLETVVRAQNENMDAKIGVMKTEVNTKIDTTKDTVIRSQEAIKGEITGSLGKLTETLNRVSRSQSAAAMDQADVQMRLAFTQKQTLQAQLAVVNQVLTKDPNDQLALTRKMQLEDFIKQNETYMQDAQQRMQRLRSAQ
jgi:hypothetical protein